MTQNQREAIADLLHFCQYADNRLSLREERSIEEAMQALGGTKTFCGMTLRPAR